MSATASERRAYPGVILSNKSTIQNEQSLESSAETNRTAFIFSEKLASGAVHLSDKRVSNTPSFVGRRPILCRTAKIRRIIKAARGHINCSSNGEISQTTDPNDTFYQVLYAHSVMSSAKAWDVTTGSDNLLAVVIDSGIDYNHNDLKSNMWRNPLEIDRNGVDDDKNGYVDDIYGVNFITNTGAPLDDNGHGTHVAGIIGAEGNNAIDRCAKLARDLNV